ncbi:MAG: nuclear transport factor 2 family protein [Galactobacter sp.]
MTQSSPTGKPGEDPRSHDDDATRIGLTWDPEATHVGIPLDPDATRVGLPVTSDGDSDTTQVGLPVTQDVDPDATQVGLPVAPTPAADAVSDEISDETFVSIREPVLPWVTPTLPAQLTATPPSAQSPSGTYSSGTRPSGEADDAAASGPRRWRRWWWVPAAAMLVVVAVVVVLAFSNHKTKADTGAAQDTVERYLDALVDGDAAAALKLWRPDSVSGEDLILEPEIYAAAKNRPTRYEIQSVTVEDGEVDIEAELTQAGETFPVSFDLRREDSGNSAWKITDGPDQGLVVTDPAPSVKVNGQEVSLPADRNKVRLAALPGDYRMVAASSRKGANYVDATVTVLPTSGEDGRSSLSFPTSEARAAIDAGAATGAGGPTPSNAKELSASDGTAMLLSPAGNIGCEFTETGKGCGLLSYRDDPRSTDSNSGKWWFDLEGGDASALQTHDSLASFQAKDADAHQMDYGETVFYEENVCAMLQTGMTCWDTRTGRGVFMSRKAYNTF